MTIILFVIILLLIGLVIAGWIGFAAGPRSDYERYLEDNLQMKAVKK